MLKRRAHADSNHKVPIRTAGFSGFSLGCLAAQERGASHGFVPEAASGPPSAYVEPFGVALAPPINLINFLFLYVANPEIAAFMPAYRAALPQEVYDCLLQHPDGYGCPYADMQKYFDEQAFDGGVVETKTVFGQALAKRTRAGSAWRHVNTDILTRLTSYWG